MLRVTARRKRPNLDGKVLATFFEGREVFSAMNP
jgi:hypothetical protein